MTLVLPLLSLLTEAHKLNLQQLQLQFMQGLQNWLGTRSSLMKTAQILKLKGGLLGSGISASSGLPDSFSVYPDRPMAQGIPPQPSRITYCCSLRVTLIALTLLPPSSTLAPGSELH